MKSSILLKTLLADTCVFEVMAPKQTIQNDKYLKLSLWYIDLSNPWKIWGEISDKIMIITNLFRYYDTEIQWVFEAYDTLKKKTKGKEWKRNRYTYNDVMCFYSHIWNEWLVDALKANFEQESNEYKILKKFRETRNKFFDHRNAFLNIEHSRVATSEIDIRFNVDDKNTIILNPSFDLIQFINILQKAVNY